MVDYRRGGHHAEMGAAMRADVQIVRVPSLPHGTTAWIDEEPNACTIWLRESDITAEQADRLRSLIAKDERYIGAFAQLIAGADAAR